MPLFNPSETGLGVAVAIEHRGDGPADALITIEPSDHDQARRITYAVRPLGRIAGENWLSTARAATLAIWVNRNAEAIIDFWEGRILFDADLRASLRLCNGQPLDFRLACAVLRGLAPKVRVISWSCGSYEMAFDRRTPDAKRLAGRFKRLGFVHPVTLHVMESKHVREKFKTGCEFMCGDRRWRCTDVGQRVVTAICLDDHPGDPTWFSGPPYAVVERVFDEYDQPACEVI